MKTSPQRDNGRGGYFSSQGNVQVSDGSHEPRRHQSIIDVEKIEAGVEREPPDDTQYS